MIRYALDDGRLHGDSLLQRGLTGYAVSAGLRGRWTLISGDSRLKLPSLLQSLGKVAPVGDGTDFCQRSVEVSEISLLYDPYIVVKHVVYAYRTTNRFKARYAFWQGYTEAVFAQKYGALQARNEPFGPLLRSMLSDFVPRTRLFCS
jgi:hypothetical protein